jgi:hypothetical protein
MVEWIQAWATVAGTLFAAAAAVSAILLLRHEIHVRRREQRDTDAAQARSVIMTIGDTDDQPPGS